MTSEEPYHGEEDTRYQVSLLKDLRASVRSIDSKVEEILEELKEHLEDRQGSHNEWTPDDAYDNDRYEEW
jgi:hypothetical protein